MDYERKSPGYDGKAICNFAALYEQLDHGAMHASKVAWDLCKPKLYVPMGRIQIISTVPEDNHFSDAIYKLWSDIADLKRLYDILDEHSHNEMLYKQERLRKLNPLNF